MAITRTDFHRVTLSDEFEHGGTTYLKLEWDSEKPGAVEATFGDHYVEGSAKLDLIDLVRLRDFVSAFEAEVASMRSA